MKKYKKVKKIMALFISFVMVVSGLYICSDSYNTYAEQLDGYLYTDNSWIRFYGSEGFTGIYAGKWSSSQYAEVGALFSFEDPYTLPVDVVSNTMNGDWLVQIEYTVRNLEIGKVYKISISDGERDIYSETIRASETSYEKIIDVNKSLTVGKKTLTLSSEEQENVENGVQEINIVANDEMITQTGNIWATWTNPIGTVKTYAYLENTNSSHGVCTEFGWFFNSYATQPMTGVDSVSTVEDGSIIVSRGRTYTLYVIAYNGYEQVIGRGSIEITIPFGGDEETIADIEGYYDCILGQWTNIDSDGWKYYVIGANLAKVKDGTSFANGPSFNIKKNNYFEYDFMVESPIYTVSKAGRYCIKLTNNEVGDTSGSYIVLQNSYGIEIARTEQKPVNQNGATDYILYANLGQGEQIKILYVQNWSSSGTKEISAEVTYMDEEETTYEEEPSYVEETIYEEVTTLKNGDVVTSPFETTTEQVTTEIIETITVEVTEPATEPQCEYETIYEVVEGNGSKMFASGEVIYYKGAVYRMIGGFANDDKDNLPDGMMGQSLWSKLFDVKQYVSQSEMGYWDFVAYEGEYVFYDPDKDGKGKIYLATQDISNAASDAPDGMWGFVWDYVASLNLAYAEEETSVEETTIEEIITEEATIEEITTPIEKKTYRATGMIDTYDTTGSSGDYKYLGYRYIGADYAYRYLTLTYHGDASVIESLRFEFRDFSDGLLGFWWFVPGGNDYFKTVDGDCLPLPSSQNKTVTIDLLASGIDMSGGLEAFHAHASGNVGKLYITNAVFTNYIPDEEEFTVAYDETTAEETTEEETTEETTTALTRPSIPTGFVVGKMGDSGALAVWEVTQEQRINGQEFILYIDGYLYGIYSGSAYVIVNNLTEDVHTFELRGYLNGYESEGVSMIVAIGNATTEEPTYPLSVDVIGAQISTTAEGFRVVYSVEGRKEDIVEKGLIFGLADYCTEEDMVVDSENSDVYYYSSTENGKSKNYLGDNKSAYIMTMNFIKTKAFYEAPLYVRAYAIRSDDSEIVYSDVKRFSVYDLASYLYNNGMMANATAHEYLYDNILKVVDEEYERVDYNWINEIVDLKDFIVG